MIEVSREELKKRLNEVAQSTDDFYDELKNMNLILLDREGWQRIKTLIDELVHIEHPKVALSRGQEEPAFFDIVEVYKKFEVYQKKLDDIIEELWKVVSDE